MSESIFDNFIDSVYSGGSALSLFDSYVGGLEVVGGADDITIESIFGGVDLSDDTIEDDPEATTHTDGGSEESIVSSLDISIGGTTTDTLKDDIMESVDDYETMFSADHKGGEVKQQDEPITHDMHFTIQAKTDDLVDTKKSDGITASDVSSMLRTYR